METPDFYAGSPVDAEDLRFRTQFIQQLWEEVDRSHVLLTAPRRTGKTSVMDHLHQNPATDFLVVSVNVQDLTHPADLFQLLLDAFHDEHPDFLRDTLAKGWSLLGNALSKVKDVGASGFKVTLKESDPDWKDSWRKHGDAFLKQLRNNSQRVLLVIDELPDMLLNMNRSQPELLREFLGWWRTARIKPNPKRDVVRWLVGGSVNLSGTLDQLGMVDLINDFNDIGLPELTSDQVVEFVNEMLGKRDVTFGESVPTTVAELLGRPIPLFLQMITQELYRLWKRRPDRPALTPGDVEQVFADFIKSSAAKDKLQHFYSRIQRYYSSPNDEAAYELLRQLSLCENGLARKTLQGELDRVIAERGGEYAVHEQRRIFNQLLRDLENDFYVIETADDVYDFASGVMKAWWRKYYA